MAPVLVTLRFRPLNSTEDPPKRTSSSASVRVLAEMVVKDFPTDAVFFPLRRDDDDGGANASVVDRVDEAASASNALTARRDGTILVCSSR